MTNTLPPFLPNILELNQDWDIILEELYNIFVNDFVVDNVFYQALKVVYDSRKIDDDKEEGFWHLITKKDNNFGRIPDYNRAKRLPWAKPTIENSNYCELKVWDYLEGSGKIRTYLWLENLDYVVILEKQKGRRQHLIVLITAFYVDAMKRNDLIRRFNKRVNNE